ncbi:hypothetical protein DOK78_002705 [Enterococcus sp. DIV2402]|uniref:DUF3021 domain-containing protein n=1 Tax=Candidatus Enterococcus lowellii TaxID=2230877 RepID=A0ABZ2SVT1_9ENTE|nr:DUF3021 family protein [Enterococcus sp. DIV2402]MBO0465046.1 DUF3021 family protein [Enterococcus sp. DIV2402]
MKIQLFLKGMLRGGIPFVIMSIIAYILYLQNSITDAKGTFYAALIAFIVGFATVIYDINQWSLTKKTVIHFLLMLLTIYPILLFSGWFPLQNITDALVIFGYFLVTGAILWSVLLFLAKKFNW